MRLFSMLAAAAAVTLTGAPFAAAQDAPAASSPAPAPAVCPDFLPQQARCWSGRAAKGGYYWIAVPENWNGSLIVHAHAAPRTGAPRADDPLEDLERFSMTVKEGFAWAGRSNRRGAYGVSMAAEETDNLSDIFGDASGRPRRTLLPGQSWGGKVAAKA